VQSNAWDDAKGNQFPANNSSTKPAAASTTTYRTSLLVCNQVTNAWNLNGDASGGVHNVVRYMEDWSGQTYKFRGSLVVLQAQRYALGQSSRQPGGASAATNDGVSLWDTYGVPARDLAFVPDLLTSQGTPPGAPFGIQPKRVVSTVQERAIEGGTR